MVATEMAWHVSSKVCDQVYLQAVLLGLQDGDSSGVGLLGLDVVMRLADVSQLKHPHDGRLGQIAHVHLQRRLALLQPLDLVDQTVDSPLRLLRRRRRRRQRSHSRPKITNATRKEINI